MTKQFYVESLMIPASAIQLPSKLVVAESKNDGKGILKISLPATVLDTKNANNRIYPTEVVKKALDMESLQRKINDGFLLCAADDHPPEPYVPPARASHYISKAWVESIDGVNYLMNEWTVLDTESGRNLRALIEGGAAFGVSIRGLGMAEEKDGVSVLTEYEYLGTDAVGNPSAGTYAGTRIPNVKVELVTTGDVPTDNRPVSADSKDDEESIQTESIRSAVGRDSIYSSWRPVTEEVIGDGEDSKSVLVQYTVSGNHFQSSTHTVESLPAGVYRIKNSLNGIHFVKGSVITDDLIEFNDPRYVRVLSEVKKFWESKPRYDEVGLMHKRGILLSGDPGTGKSCLLKLISKYAVENGYPVFLVTDFGDTATALREFKEIEPDRQFLVVIEDIDRVTKYDEHVLLQFMDGDAQLNGALVLATTNYPDDLPPRVLRPGRFDTRVEIGPPPAEGRRAYLSSKIKNSDLVDELVEKTDGFTFGQLRELVVSMVVLDNDVDTAISRVLGGFEYAKESSTSVSDKSMNEFRGGKQMINIKEATQLPAPYDIKSGDVIVAAKGEVIDLQVTPNEDGSYHFRVDGPAGTVEFDYASSSSAIKDGWPSNLFESMDNDEDDNEDEDEMMDGKKKCGESSLDSAIQSMVNSVQSLIDEGKISHATREIIKHERELLSQAEGDEIAKVVEKVEELKTRVLDVTPESSPVSRPTKTKIDPREAIARICKDVSSMREALKDILADDVTAESLRQTIRALDAKSKMIPHYKSLANDSSKTVHDMLKSLQEATGNDSASPTELLESVLVSLADTYETLETTEADLVKFSRLVEASRKEVRDKITKLESDLRARNMLLDQARVLLRKLVKTNEHKSSTVSASKEIAHTAEAIIARNPWLADFRVELYQAESVSDVLVRARRYAGLGKISRALNEPTVSRNGREKMLPIGFK